MAPTVISKSREGLPQQNGGAQLVDVDGKFFGGDFRSKCFARQLKHLAPCIKVFVCTVTINLILMWTIKIAPMLPLVTAWAGLVFMALALSPSLVLRIVPLAVLFKLFLCVFHIAEWHFWVINVADSVLWWIATWAASVERYSEGGVASTLDVASLGFLITVQLALFAWAFKILTIQTLAEAEKEAQLRARAEKGRDSFMSYIMHEMRNPLYGAALLILEFQETLRELKKAARQSARKKADQAADSLRASIDETSSRLRRLTEFLASPFDKMKGVCDDLLQLEKLDKGGFEYVFRPADVRAFVAKVAAQAAPLFGEKAATARGEKASAAARSSVTQQGVSFSWSFEFTCPDVEALLATRPVGVADFLRLDQVVSNFISNAKKFTKTGSVSLRCTLSFTTAPPTAAASPFSHDTTLPPGSKKPESDPSSGGLFALGSSASSASKLPPSSQIKQWETALALEKEGSPIQDAAEEEDKEERGDQERPPPPSEDNAGSDSMPSVLMRVEVQDSGPGLSEEDIGKLFKPYGQVRAGEMQNGGGTGLGLVICKSFVEAHMGGRIGVESAGRGEGSTFFFEVCLPLLPAHHDPPHGKTGLEQSETVGAKDSLSQSSLCATSLAQSPAVSARRLSAAGVITPERRMSYVSGIWNLHQTGLAAQSPPWTPTRTTKAKPSGMTPETCEGSPPSKTPVFLPDPSGAQVDSDVLLVDDDRFCLMAASGAIRRLGYSVLPAEDGDEAVDLVVKQGRSFRLILIDKNMGRVDGPAAVHQISAHLGALKGQMKGGENSEKVTVSPSQLVAPIVGLTGDALEEACEEFLVAGADEVLLKPLKLTDLKALLGQV
uniref:histidine kinase n=1 Tax=Chromera velia CCMP2878 TaxID=1169474 RepID=A0A0G4GZQ4_9ALVE|eukprot:Cvel_5447.t1-p1 / transcript=Cvel_5447.t1 / gene=Cvel_5447 / organism=Chromera_velia_CCMP2878 / gene_product=Sensor protein GacS, putative / transcript_product=Sensor protein GacS, putative / location=Cvel_scaffold254:68028-71183(-) / protein_length=836 / sequence_SO=supercontig / SO=protein_coding / is_pseudo=false